MVGHLKLVSGLRLTPNATKPFRNLEGASILIPWNDPFCVHGGLDKVLNPSSKKRPVSERIFSFWNPSNPSKEHLSFSGLTLVTLATFFWHFRGWHCGHDLSCFFVGWFELLFYFPVSNAWELFLKPPPTVCISGSPRSMQGSRRWKRPGAEKDATKNSWLRHFREITGSHTTWQVAYFFYILHLVGATVVGWETNGWELCHLFFSYSTVQRFWASNVLLLGRNNGLWFFLRSICFADFLEFLGFLIK